MKSRVLSVFLMIFFVVTGTASATTYNLQENPNDNVVTQYSDNAAFISIEQDETLLDVALRFSLGKE